jgi:hypothetical protein
MGRIMALGEAPSASAFKIGATSDLLFALRVASAHHRFSRFDFPMLMFHAPNACVQTYFADLTCENSIIEL